VQEGWTDGFAVAVSQSRAVLSDDPVTASQASGESATPKWRPGGPGAGSGRKCVWESQTWAVPSKLPVMNRLPSSRKTMALMLSRWSLTACPWGWPVRKVPGLHFAIRAAGEKAVPLRTESQAQRQIPQLTAMA